MIANCETIFTVISFQQYFLSSQELFSLLSQVLNIETTSGATPQHIPLGPLRTWPYKHFLKSNQSMFPTDKNKMLMIKVFMWVSSLQQKVLKVEQKTMQTQKDKEDGR